jgi:hypothetical protein
MEKKTEYGKREKFALLTFSSVAGKLVGIFFEALFCGKIFFIKRFLQTLALVLVLKNRLVKLSFRF